MRYTVQLSGETHAVQVQSLGAGRYRVQIDEGPARTVEAALMGPQVHLIHAGQSHTVRLGARHAATSGRGVPCEVIDARTARLRARQGGLGDAGAAVIRSPMPGRVVKLLVAEGDAVRAGQGVVIVEAMKMENELKAEIDGVVEALRCGPGDTVEANADLVVLRPLEG